MAFRKAGDLLAGMDIPAKIAARIAQDDEKRAEGVLMYQWDPSCVCVDCGDTGTIPRTNEVCWCDTGREVRRLREYERHWNDLVPEAQRHFQLCTHPNAKLADDVARWVSSMFLTAPRGPNLVLTGPVGTGKTGVAVAALRPFVMNGTRCMYGTVPRILEALRPVFSNQPEEVTALRTSIERVCSIPMLLLDDLGTEKRGEWPAERLTIIFDERHKRNLPTIITTNIKPDDLPKAVGERIASRITAGATILVAGGQDLRRNTLFPME